MEKKMTEQDDIKKIREMLEFLVKQKIKDRMSKLDATERKIYELTGVKGQKEMVKILKVGEHTVSNLWKTLEEEGILIKEGKVYKKIV
jgi:predicted ATPase